MALLLVHGLNALSFSALLLLLGLGLSVVLGLMNFVNLLHGSFFLLGAYVAVWAFAAGLPWLAVPLGFVAAGLVGAAGERALFRHFYARDHLHQVLLTFGLSLVAADLLRWGFGSAVLVPALPEALLGVAFVGDVPVPLYRLFVAGAGLAGALLLWWGMERTRWGVVLRACVADRAVVETLGIDTRLVLAGAMALAAGLGGVAGALGAGMLGAYPGLDEEVLLLALLVVVVGGAGSFRGTALGAVAVGGTLTVAPLLLPGFGRAAALAALALLLLLRPGGLVAAAVRSV